MKIFVIYAAFFLTFALATLAEEETKPVETNANQAENEKYEKQRAENEAVCREKSGATEEQIQFLRKEPKSEQPQAVKCYVNCILERITDDKTHDFKKDTFDIYTIDGVSKEQAKKNVKECSAQKEVHTCEGSYQMYVCITEKSGYVKI